MEMGGFDANCRFLEDIDLGYRMHRAGHRIFLAKHLQATHAKFYSLRSFVRSEVLGRAAPWTRLMLKFGIFRNDLNTRIGNVLSVAVVCLLPVSIVFDPYLRVAGCLALLFLWLNRGYLRLAIREYGIVFAAQCTLLCGLDYALSAVGLWMGVGAWLRDSGESETAREGLADSRDA